LIVATPTTISPSKLPALRAAIQQVIQQHFHLSPFSDAAVVDALSGVELFDTPFVNRLKAEIVSAGRKLWQRAYVDGNGGNISARITDNLVLCTPTLCSKGSLNPDELTIVDLDNNRVFGLRPHTSEILLHLEIYKTVPQARAVIHCHPPHATAHAIAHVIPQGDLIPEQEVFVGPVALAPYETPGTTAFARTILPFVRQHNTILLANHGIVCWADSVEHSEWYVEVVETYCKTLMIAQKLRQPLPQIPAAKIQDLLDLKKKLGLPDARLPLEESAAEQSLSQPGPTSPDPGEFNALIDELTLGVLGAMGEQA
jgi:L-fuculose-phosphate aldolase